MDMIVFCVCLIEGRRGGAVVLCNDVTGCLLVPQEVSRQQADQKQAKRRRKL